MTPEQIAAGLSPAQRREIASDAPWFMSGMTGQVLRHTAWLELAEMQIAPDIFARLAACYGGWWRLTPLGQAVRAIVAKEAADDR